MRSNGGKWRLKFIRLKQESGGIKTKTHSSRVGLGDIPSPEDFTEIMNLSDFLLQGMCVINAVALKW